VRIAVGCKPIRASKNWFFKDKVFKQRAAMAPAVIRKQGLGIWSPYRFAGVALRLEATWIDYPENW